MVEFVLERVISAAPENVFAVALDPGLHLRSMARYGETMVEAPAGGTFTEGTTVTWRARHFGIPFRLRSVVYDIDPPHGFRDRQISGPFGSFWHEHVFEEHPRGTLMRDTIRFRSPFGPIGRLVDRLVLGEYMRRLIEERNDHVQSEAEERGRTLPA
ncbi:ligand-binding SRPBCC domain-containing protein [Microbacterium phyllosphaerae]|uniref:Ligand-binding SRPBCC domain-containing protein n=1 Tax=Microbacterium phyllosphaerae TaxID=124798 RepID=A0ABS4WJZ1_9MICO|nr:SRPBCC family protein [Microbacterium phyllosphaerae]MBP2376520.1 ligand-binding SRPBCC domain-containing protein [Microbacterium phyllosphaerae]